MEATVAAEDTTVEATIEDMEEVDMTEVVEATVAVGVMMMATVAEVTVAAGDTVVEDIRYSS